MIDAHLASLAWHAAMLLILTGGSFLAGRAYQEHQDNKRREWDARRRARQMRVVLDRKRFDWAIPLDGEPNTWGPR